MVVSQVLTLVLFPFPGDALMLQVLMSLKFAVSLWDQSVEWAQHRVFQLEQNHQRDFFPGPANLILTRHSASRPWPSSTNETTKSNSEGGSKARCMSRAQSSSTSPWRANMQPADSLKLGMAVKAVPPPLATSSLHWTHSKHVWDTMTWCKRHHQGLFGSVRLHRKQQKSHQRMLKDLRFFAKNELVLTKEPTRLDPIRGLDNDFCAVIVTALRIFTRSFDEAPPVLSPSVWSLKISSVFREKTTALYDTNVRILIMAATLRSSYAPKKFNSPTMLFGNLDGIHLWWKKVEVDLHCTGRFAMHTNC